MRLVRFSAGGPPRWGRWTPAGIEGLRGDPYNRPEPDGTLVPTDAAALLAPVDPSKVVGVGLNYKEHARESKLPLPPEPTLFLKPTTAIIGPGDAVVLPPQSQRVEFEAELAIVIKSRCRHVSRERALQHVLGYTCCNDVTARDLQLQDGQWVRAKGFDTFLPIGPWIEDTWVCDSQRIVLRQNGQVRQDSAIHNMIFPLDELISYISRQMTLLPGDVIITGTPHGVAPVAPGDRLEVEIDGIGLLANPVTVGA